MSSTPFNAHFEPIPGYAHSQSGNAQNGICLAEANRNTAHCNVRPHLLPGIVTTSSTSNAGLMPPSFITPTQHQPTSSAPWIFKARGPTVAVPQLRSTDYKNSVPTPFSSQVLRAPIGFSNNSLTLIRPTVQWALPLQQVQSVRSPQVRVAPRKTSRSNSRPAIFLAPSEIHSTQAPSLSATAAVLQPPHYDSVAIKQLYVRPFESSTSAEQVALYISNKTGWNSNSFNCQRLAPSTRRNNRPLSFVSFKISVIDHPSFVELISSSSFWPDFVTVEPFEQRKRR